MDIFIPLSFVLAFIGGLLIYSSSKKQTTKQVSNSLNPNLKKIDAKVRVSSASNFSIVTGISSKSNIYLSDSYMLITNKNYSLFSFPSRHLPIVITGNINLTKDSFRNSNIRILKPDKIKLTNWNSINIKWTEKLSISIKYDISIRLENKSDIEYLKNIEIEKWCLEK